MDSPDLPLFSKLTGHRRLMERRSSQVGTLREERPTQKGQSLRRLLYFSTDKRDTGESYPRPLLVHSERVLRLDGYLIITSNRDPKWIRRSL